MRKRVFVARGIGSAPQYFQQREHLGLLQRQYPEEARQTPPRQNPGTSTVRSSSHKRELSLTRVPFDVFVRIFIEPFTAQTGGFVVPEITSLTASTFRHHRE